MKPPDLPPVPPGRSALPAFLPVEAWARERVADARTRAAARLTDAQDEAARMRDEGERGLREIVLEGEREALRRVEDAARDRLGEARRAVEAWTSAAEGRVDDLVREALVLLTQHVPSEQVPSQRSPSEQGSSERWPSEPTGPSGPDPVRTRGVASVEPTSPE